MTQESSQSSLNEHNVQTTFYVSLIVANLLFGLLHPEYLLIATTGVGFFTFRVLLHLHPGAQE